MKKILILSANPFDNTIRLKLDKEFNEIKEALRRATHRGQFTIVSEWAVSFDSLRRALLDHEPQIVHFSGHGDEEGLIMEGDWGIGVSISSEALSSLFELFSNYVECVILNACYTAPQAAAINKHINYVIGTPGKINDYDAIKFSVAFYDALFAGKTVDEAFDLGCTVFPNSNIPEKFFPRLYKRKSVHFQSKKTTDPDIATNFFAPPSLPQTSQMPQQQIGFTPIINAKKIGEINYIPGGTVFKTETNYNNYTAKKKEK
ncbi:MAG: CHAT domain-containing protein [Candidatus Omnitrophota bacterium]